MTIATIILMQLLQENKKESMFNDRKSKQNCFRNQNTLLSLLYIIQNIICISIILILSFKKLTHKVESIEHTYKDIVNCKYINTFSLHGDINLPLS